MTYTVYGSPSVPSEPVPDPWSHLQMTWTGADGVTWSLTGTRTAGIRMQAGMTGLTMPPFQRHKSESPARGGTRFRGVDTLERDVLWPLWVWQQSGSKAWLKHDAAFRRSLHPDREGQWAVTQPEIGVTRTLKLRCTSDGGKAWDKTPGSRGWAAYDLEMVAEDPYWRGAPVVSPVWARTEDVDFTGPDDEAPDFYISDGILIGSASMSNPGDVPAWPTWTLRGPIDAGAAVSVDGFTIGIPFAIADGETLVITTETGGARLNGERVGNLLSPREFEPIPDGTDVPIGLAFEGAGSVQASLVPKHFAAWGVE